MAKREKYESEYQADERRIMRWVLIAGVSCFTLSFFSLIFAVTYTG